MPNTTEEPQFDDVKLIQILAASGTIPGKRFSLTKTVSDIEKFGNDCLDQILFDTKALLFRANGERVDLAIKIGVKNPKERKAVMEAISASSLIDSQNASADVPTINQQFAKNKITYRFPANLSPELLKTLKRAKIVQRVINNIQCLEKKFLADHIFPYSKRYSKMPAPEIQASATAYQSALDNMRQNIGDTKKMAKIATDTLVNNGYPKIAIEGKDPGQLANTLFYEMIASQAVINVRKQTDKPSQGDIYDQIAILLMQKVDRF